MKASPPGMENSSSQGVPRQTSFTSTATLLFLFAIPSSGKQHVLNVITHPAVPGLQYGPGASLTEASHVSFFLNQNTLLIRPALRNQSSSTFFSERAAQGLCEPTLAWEKGLERKPMLKLVLKCNKNILNPFEINRRKRGLQSFKLPVTAGHP